VTESSAGDPSRPSGNGFVLEIEDVRRSFGERRALDGVTLRLQEGEIYGLLGPNGAGKTSLIRAICGRLRLESGRVSLLGSDLVNDSAARRMLGLVPQDLALYADLTARENLEIFGRLMGMSRHASSAAAPRLLEQVGLLDRGDQQVTTLSGGMKRRLNVAAGVVHQPRVLLLDEPTVGVDPTARESIHELLLDLRSQGLSILLTTHDLEQAEELSNRVGILIDGRIRAEGKVSDLVTDVFGDGKELLVALRSVPEARGIDHLTGGGFEPSRDRRVWTGLLETGLENLSELSDGLKRVGLDVGEIRVREPGLRGVFFRLAGREIDA